MAKSVREVEGTCSCKCGEAVSPGSKFISGHNRRKSPIHFVANESTGCWDWLSGKDGSGYGNIPTKTGMVRAHRVYYEWWYGKIPLGLHVDHICRNRSCVNPAHLRCVTRSANLRNTPVRKKSKTGFKGVYPNGRGMFFVTITVGSKAVYVGTFSSVVTAAHAYDHAVRQLFPNDIRRTNFPGSGEFPARLK